MPRIQDLSLQKLQYVVAVADTLGFRKAAEVCHVSQPSLSAQVRELEETLGVKLFERDRRRVLVTAAGADLVAHARRVLREAEALVEAAVRFGDPLAGPLRIGIIPTIAPYLLPEAVPAVMARFPKLRPLFREEKTEVLVEDLAAGRLDAAVLALEADLGDLAHAVIAADPFVLAAPKSHPLSKRRRITAADLEGETVLLLDDGHCLAGQALSYCANARANEASFRATSLSTLAQMVSGGAGVTLLPALSVPIENRRGQLAIRPFAAPQPSRTVALAWRPSSPMVRALKELAAVLRKAWP
ncbi:Hydrogen peroxide-inducible activator [Minicystis rosea]|nr:Hydrogen peroxide-inducible activator [Minicystis rosea]